MTLRVIKIVSFLGATRLIGLFNQEFNVIYDGSCKFCVSTINRFRRIIRSDMICFTDSHDEFTIKNEFPALLSRDLDSAMYVIERNGRIYSGFFAVRRLFLGTPFILLAFLLYLPGLSGIGTHLYNWFACHRRDLSCARA